MKRFFLVLSLLATAMYAFAQPKEIPLNSKTVFKDINGNLISFDTFLAWTSGTGYEIAPSFDADGKLLEVFVLDAAVAPATPRRSSAPLSTAPPFSGSDLNNRQFDMGNLLGKVVVMKFWFAACKPCVDEMPQLNKVVEHFRGNSDVVFLAPSLDKAARIQSFLTKHPFSYNIIPEGKNIAEQFGVYGYPTHFVINRSGKIEATYSGVNRSIEDKLIAAINNGLNPPEVLDIVEDVPPPPLPKEVEITPQSIIKNEDGKLVTFDQFVVLMQDGYYELVNAKDEEGDYVLMKAVKR